MSEASRKIGMEELMKYSDNLVELLKEEKDFAGLKHFLKQSNALQSQCQKDFSQVQKSIEDYEKKIDACKQKTIAAQLDTAADSELESLQKQLEEQQKQEQILSEDLRVIVKEIEGLDRERESIEEQRRSIEKSGQNQRKTQMELSMCASVTKTIPCLDDPYKISGHIIDREKKISEKFEFDDPSNTSSSFETCNNIWKMINL